MFFRCCTKSAAASAAFHCWYSKPIMSDRPSSRKNISVLQLSTACAQNRLRRAFSPWVSSPDRKRLLCHTPSPDALQAIPNSSSRHTAASLTAPSDSQTPAGLRPR